MPAPLRLMLQARLVLAAFLLSLGVAIAAPALQPVALEMVCSGSGGMALIERPLRADGDGIPQARSLIDCPLCVPAAAPPLAATALPPLALPALALPSWVPDRVTTVRTDAPAPARGPPPASSLTRHS